MTANGDGMVKLIRHFLLPCTFSYLISSSLWSCYQAGKEVEDTCSSDDVQLLDESALRCKEIKRLLPVLKLTFISFLAL